VRFLTPTGNKRLNELIGFLCFAVAVLIACALLSYSPRDAAFNVSAKGEASANWIGPVGAYSADGIFQLLGFPAFLLPLAALWMSIKWFRSQAVGAPKITLAGFLMLLVFLPAFLTLVPFPDVRGAVPAGGMVGNLLAGALLSGFNKAGALIVASARYASSEERASMLIVLPASIFAFATVESASVMSRVAATAGDLDLPDTSA